ncbi:MAG TPA: T9SS type A sorting domain-containing protein, partial [Bacteroidota bacterium]|nr:T9SS type A sorting domain-containing protein [Bacteroidota bacterium]
IRGIPTNAAVKDTFTMVCTNGDGSAGSADFTYRWPVMSYMAARCDSMFLVDKTAQLTTDGSTPLGKIDMLAQGSVFIFEPLTTFPSFKLQIYAYGVHMVDSVTIPVLPLPTSVREVSHQIPSSFTLRQNYPNPFNPTTTVRFDIQKQSVTEIAVYNLLGQKVATLISQNLMPGTYSAVWNGLTAKGLSAGSGVYFIRMTASPTDGKGGVFSSLQKIVLMK